MSARKGVRRRAKHELITGFARKHPGEWVFVQQYQALYVAKSMVGTIEGTSGFTKIHGYTPAGEFKGRYVMADDGWDVYVMYVGALPDQPVTT